MGGLVNDGSVGLTYGSGLRFEAGLGSGGLAGGLLPLRLVATRGAVPQLVSGVISTENQLRKIFRTRHYTGSVAPTEIRLVFCNYYCSGTTGEIAVPNTTQVGATLEWPGSPAGYYRATFNGSTMYTMSSGEALVISDPIYPSHLGLSAYTPNTLIWVRQALTIPNGGVIMLSNTASIPAISGESAAQCTPDTDPQLDATGALVGTGAYASWSYRNPPLAIIGRTATKQVTAAGIGNSIVWRVADNPGDGENGAGGWFQRGLASVNGNHVPYIILASPGETASAYVNNSARRRLTYPWITNAMCDHGTNDLTLSQSPATILGNLRTIWSGLNNAGISAEQMLILVKTASTDSWATLANQTPTTGFAAAGNRDILNASIIANVGSNGLTNYLSMNGVTADSVEPSKWVVTGAANYATTDGTHPSVAMHGLMAPVFNTRAATWTPPQ